MHRRVDESKTDQVISGILALIPRVTSGIRFQLAAVRTEDLDLVTVFNESQYECVNSLHQKPIAQPVCFDNAGFEATMATCFGRSGFKMSIAALIFKPLSLLGQHLERMRPLVSQVARNAPQRAERFDGSCGGDASAFSRS